MIENKWLGRRGSNPFRCFTPCYFSLSRHLTFISSYVGGLGLLTDAQVAAVANALNGQTITDTLVYLWSSGSSGYVTPYQNTVDDSPKGNGDQGHHFAAFFEYGYLHLNAPGGGGATVFEWLEALVGGGPANDGDINLGMVAFQIGADLATGKIKTSAVGQRIENLCAH